MLEYSLNSLEQDKKRIGDQIHSFEQELQELHRQEAESKVSRRILTFSGKRTSFDSISIAYTSSKDRRLEKFFDPISQTISRN